MNRPWTSSLLLNMIIINNVVVILDCRRNVCRNLGKRLDRILATVTWLFRFANRCQCYVSRRADDKSDQTSWTYHESDGISKRAFAHKFAVRYKLTCNLYNCILIYRVFKKLFVSRIIGSKITIIWTTTIIQLASKCYFGAGNLLKLISINLKIKTYMTLIRPNILYCSETWALRKTEEIRLDKIERKLRKDEFMAHILTREPENEKYKPMKSFKTYFKNRTYQGKLQKESINVSLEIEGRIDKSRNKRGSDKKRPLDRPRLRWK